MAYGLKASSCHPLKFITEKLNAIGTVHKHLLGGPDTKMGGL